MTRPHALALNVAGVPSTLRGERRWVCWRYEHRDGRWTKIPCQQSGHHAKTNDPTTWCSFAEAVAAYRAGGFDGVGFCLGDGWVGVDIDHCYADKHTSQAVAGAQELIERLSCYVEISPSETGVKAIGRAPRIGGQIDFAVDPPTFTTWSNARFFAVTGAGEGDPTRDISSFLDDWFPASPIAASFTPRHGYQDAANISDDALLMQAVGADNGDKFLALWRGDTSEYGHDHSRADQALVSMLAFWTNYDAERIDRLFRQSGLMRPKWDTDSYRRSTLGKVLR